MLKSQLDAKRGGIVFHMHEYGRLALSQLRSHVDLLGKNAHDDVRQAGHGQRRLLAQTQGARPQTKRNIQAPTHTACDP